MSLQAGRAIAAILVVLYHLGGMIAVEKYFGQPIFGIPFSFGDAGVEFFFVLSGFIILTAHRKDISKPYRVISYLKKRIARIYPTYWIIFFGVYIYAMMSDTLINDVPHDFFIVLKSLLLFPQNMDVVGGTGAPVLIVAWTLQYEVLFYMFFAIMIINRLASIALSVVWLYMYINFSGDTSLHFLLSFLVSDYIFLFIIGMAVSIIFRSNSVLVKNYGFNIVIGVLVFSFVALDEIIKTNLVMERQTLLYGLASGLIILGLVKAESSGRIIGGNRWLQLLGDSSYALYLIHLPLISLLCKLSVSFGLNNFGFLGALVSFVLFFCACVVSSVVFHLWIERPIASYIRTFFVQRAVEDLRSSNG